MYGFIVNKHSGSGRGAKIWREVESILEARQIPYCYRTTCHRGHGTQLTFELLQENDPKVIVAVGGDGTVNEVLNALVGSNVPLGVLPAGSGNDLCRELDIPLNWRMALDNLLEGRVRSIDVGEVLKHNGEPRYYSTVAGIGFDGQVALATNESKYKGIMNTLRMGKVSYVLSVLNVLWGYSPSNLTLTIDGENRTFSNVWLVAVANSSFYGGGMRISPAAKADDGWLDVCIVSNVSKWELLKLFPQVYKGKHIDHHFVETFCCKEIQVESDVPYIIHADGEILGQTPLTIRNKQNCLYVV
ncbi:diacylglycerol kinase family protein [Alkalihalobacillus sp. TS-13]|uniref:diacylglycerol/lipid kinase family protein n=1 Tax=Alkalihalobacillus sp. TS-13 TaxID=2842455 RepID=UPI001C88D57A|nr:diacylglycerol kinase family protein [Alkalihalobacillus sp. TS-13]